MSTRSWHDKFDWKAEEYFDDPLVIRLCQAIESNDLEEIERLVSTGVNVNTKGKGNITPLLWAFPDNKLHRFKKLLELKADPNVVVSAEVETSLKGIRPGNSVTLMATKTRFPGYFDAVFQHGADPNIEEKDVIAVGDTPLFYVIKHGTDKLDRIKTLIEKGADIDHVNGVGATPMIQAASWGGRYDISLFLLNSGADPKMFNFHNLRLIHVLLFEKERREKIWTRKQQRDFYKLVETLETEYNEKLAEAKSDMELWDSWREKPIQKKERIRKVILERDARKAMARNETFQENK